jgi:hypothetical protein
MTSCKFNAKNCLFFSGGVIHILFF